MPGRILTLQRQARELGRLRTGTYEQPTGAKGRPVRSKTWIFTSHQRDYIDAAAALWGGTVHEWTPQGGGATGWRVITDAVSIDAIMPPGDPLSQHNEMWSKGGCQLRCDGVTELIGDRPCVCLARYGDTFYERTPEEVCRPHTRLNVIVPALPDLGVWRVESKGYYAANEIAAAVDLIRSATGGSAAVPIRLRIEPRSRVAAGKTKRFPVIVVEIRGATAGQILAGSPPAVELGGPTERMALAAAPAPAGEPLTAARVLELARYATNGTQVRGLWKDAAGAGVLTEEVKAQLTARAAELNGGDTPAAKAAAAAPPAAAEPAVEGEIEPDADTMWLQIVTVAGGKGWSMEDLEKRVCAFTGSSSDECDGFDLTKFLDAVKAGEV